MLIVILLCVEALGALGALVTASFLAFLTFVMRGLRTLPTADGIKAMNAINLATAKPIKLMLSATSLLCLAAAPIWYVEFGAVMALAGGAAFGLGAILVTLERSVPLNKYLGTATDASGQMIWRIYRRDWVMWNHLRAAACAVAGAFFIMATVLHILHVIDMERMRAVDHGDPICLPCPNTKAD
jgi:uncharacterized membrane protein